MQRQIWAAFDPDGIFVYQAFKPSIADEALRLGTFGKGFSLDRMTWIKPSFGWMLYRSQYASLHRQERILRIKLSHRGFLIILAQAVPTAYEPSLFATEEVWRSALKHSEVRYQWDPDRDLYLHRLERRALQLGLQGNMVTAYVEQWILGIEDVTSLARILKSTVTQKDAVLPAVPTEQIYEVDSELQLRLMLTP